MYNVGRYDIRIAGSRNDQHHRAHVGRQIQDLRRRGANVNPQRDFQRDNGFRSVKSQGHYNNKRSRSDL